MEKCLYTTVIIKYIDQSTNIQYIKLSLCDRQPVGILNNDGKHGHIVEFYIQINQTSLCVDIYIHIRFNTA